MMNEIRVIITPSDFMNTSSDEERKFITRMKLRSVGIPIGEWEEQTVTKGIIEWKDDPYTGNRVFIWKDK